MGATNTTENSKKYYKLKEDKRDNSISKGENRFFEQVKKQEGWGDGSEFNSMSGYVQNVSIKEYEYEGAKKEALNIELLDDEDNKTVCVVSLGFNTFTAQGILNTLAGEPILGVIKFSCGKPSSAGYPTLWINNNGEKTKWKYSKENNNLDLIPKVTQVTDEEGNKIKKGMKSNLEFWRGVLKEVSNKCTPTKPLNVNSVNTVAPTKQDIPAMENPFDGNDDLPF